jgi:hypothetical protein
LLDLALELTDQGTQLLLRVTIRRCGRHGARRR